MRFKKLVSGLLACALVATSVFTGDVATAKAEQTAEPAAEIVSGDPIPVSTYNFQVSGDNAQGTLGSGVVLKSSPNNAANSPELNDYTEAPKFVAGRSGKAGDYAVDTEGKHGIVLPDKQLGENYTVSFWVKPTDVTKGKWATSVLFVGRSEVTAEPAQWVSMCTADNKGTLDCWSLGNSDNRQIALKQDEWQMLTIVQSGEGAKFYLNGEKKIDKSTGYHKAMVDANQYIALGTNHWDGNFYGCYDDVSVYNQTLTDDQVYRLYSGKGEKELFTEGAFSIDPSEAFKLLKAKSRTVSAVLPNGVSKENVTVSFASNKPEFAAVDAETGEVTGVAAGTATITATATYKDSTVQPKTATVDVTVEEPKGNALAADYDFANSTGKILKDISGNGHDATIHGADAKFENGALVFHGGKKDAADPDYVDLPIGILESLDDPEQFTIEVEFSKTDDVLNAWLFCLGATPSEPGYNYLFLSPNFENTKLRSGIRGNSGTGTATEKLFNTSSVPEKGKSYTVYMVFDQGKISLYWNGIKIQGEGGKEFLDSGYSLMEDVVKNGCKGDYANILGYIGKSCWSPDEYYKGTVSKFKIHNKVMTDDEVAETFSETFNKIFKADIEKSLLGDKNEAMDKVLYNLPLPSNYEGAAITWTSNKPEVISADGTVNNQAANTDVELTATVVSGKLTGTAKFNFTVLPADRSSLAEPVENAKKAKEDPFRSDKSKAELESLIAKAATVNQSGIEKLIADINKAIEKADYSPLYMNPFTEIKDDFNPAISDMITLSPNKTATVKKDGVEVPASVKDAVEITYESLAPEVATVDENGTVSGKTVGYAMIVTKLSAKYDQFTLEYYTLVKVDLNMNGVKASAKAASLAKGKTTTVKLTIPKEISDLKPTKTYRATGAVSVNKTTGKITAKSAGTGKVYVKVSAAGKSITKSFNVNVGELTGPATVKVKKSITLKVKGLKGKVAWSLDKNGKKLATIKNGKLTAKKKAGKVKVTAKVGKVTMTKTITIKKK